MWSPSMSGTPARATFSFETAAEYQRFLDAALAMPASRCSRRCTDAWFMGAGNVMTPEPFGMASPKVILHAEIIVIPLMDRRSGVP
jgi:hypothetical protein